MTREKFLRLLRAYARRCGLAFVVHAARGKGAHARVELAGAWTTVQSGELTPFHVRRCCDQLGVDPEDL